MTDTLDKIRTNIAHYAECSITPSQATVAEWAARLAALPAIPVERLGALSADERKFPAPRSYGEQCPVGMVQVEFVGCSPSSRMHDYGWAPERGAFIDVWVDGHRYNITIGTFESREKRRGLHIIGPCDIEVDKHSLNALDVYRPAALDALTKEPQQ
jgi:hypothetical protein